MGAVSPWHLLILAVVVVALFGAKRLPETARGIGQSLKILKSELHSDPAPQATETPNAALPTSTASVSTAPAGSVPSGQQASTNTTAASHQQH